MQPGYSHVKTGLHKQFTTRLKSSYDQLKTASEGLRTMLRMRDHLSTTNNVTSIIRSYFYEINANGGL